MTDPDIHDNTGAHRYELPVGGEVAVVIYNLSDKNLMITETLVPEALEGRGIASRRCGAGRIRLRRLDGRNLLGKRRSRDGHRQGGQGEGFLEHGGTCQMSRWDQE